MEFNEILVFLSGFAGAGGGALAIIRSFLKKYFKQVNNAIKQAEAFQKYAPIFENIIKEHSEVTTALKETIDRHAWLSAEFEKNANEVEALKSGLLGLNARRLRSDCGYWIDLEYCPTVEKQMLQTLYEGYHALGGNGVITALFNSVLALPTKK